MYKGFSRLYASEALSFLTSYIRQEENSIYGNKNKKMFPKHSSSTGICNNLIRKSISNLFITQRGRKAVCGEKLA
jgi:hypothetical protein